MKQLPRVMRLIILQINYSHKMKNTFRTLVAAKEARGSLNTGPEKNSRDNDTRWLSTYRMIDRFIHFREEIMTVLRLTHGDFVESSADLEKFQLTSQDWKYLEALRDVLEIFRAPTLILQASSYPTINQTIPLVCGVLHELSSAKETDTLIANPLIAFGLEEARKKLLEYNPVDDENCMENKMLYVAIVLDPRYKLAIFENVGFSAEKISGIKSAFCQVYSDYQKNEENATVDESAGAESVTSEVSNGSGWFFLDDNATEGNSDELEVYLRDPRESKSMDVLAFYKIHKKRFPIISRIARDYFAVPAMSAPSEALFSRVGNIATSRRGRLLSRSIKMLAILKSRGIITADEMPAEEADKEEEQNTQKFPEFISAQTQMEDTELVIDIEPHVEYEKEV